MLIDWWWGYRHVTGTLQVKRYFGMRDLWNAHSSQFVEKVHGPFPAEDREDALKKLQIFLDGGHL
jgi:hypothetical protein